MYAVLQIEISIRYAIFRNHEIQNSKEISVFSTLIKIFLLHVRLDRSAVI